MQTRNKRNVSWQLGNGLAMVNSDVCLHSGRSVYLWPDLAKPPSAAFKLQLCTLLL